MHEFHAWCRLASQWALCVSSALSVLVCYFGFGSIGAPAVKGVLGGHGCPTGAPGFGPHPTPLVWQ